MRKTFVGIAGVVTSVSCLLVFVLVSFLHQPGYEDDLSKADTWGDDELGAYASVLRDDGGRQWLIVKGNCETKVLYRNESFYLVRDFVPSYVVRDLGFRPTFRVLCRLRADASDETMVDAAWDLRDGSRVK